MSTSGGDPMFKGHPVSAVVEGQKHNGNPQVMPMNDSTATFQDSKTGAAAAFNDYFQRKAANKP